MHCCLVDEGRWPWWAVNSSLIHNLLFLHWIPNSLGTEDHLFWEVINRNGVQNPVICLWFCLPSVCSQFYCLQFGNRLPVLPEEQISHQSETYSALFSGEFFVPLTSVMQISGSPTLHHVMARQSYCRNFLCFCPKGKYHKWSYPYLFSDLLERNAWGRVNL